MGVWSRLVTFSSYFYLIVSNLAGKLVIKLAIAVPLIIHPTVRFMPNISFAVLKFGLGPGADPQWGRRGLETPLPPPGQWRPP